MIRLKKSYPNEFEEEVNPQSEKVKEKLIADQNGKCYLCERITETDFQVEHLRSRKDCGEFERKWNNLLLACSYCNQKKGSNDIIINPLNIDVEVAIKQKIDFENKQVQFSLVSNSENLDFKPVINLLGDIFNGNVKPRKIKEERFFDHVLAGLNLFQGVLREYIEEPTPEHAEKVRTLLNIKEEFLGLKYWIIKSNPKLEREFAKDIVWNKDADKTEM
jgi:bacteriophage lambda ninG protein